MRAKTFVPFLPAREKYEDTQADNALTLVAQDNEKNPVAGLKYLTGEQRQGYTFAAGVAQQIPHRLGRAPAGIVVVNSHVNANDVTGRRVANPAGFADDKFFSFRFAANCTVSFLVW